MVSGLLTLETAYYRKARLDTSKRETHYHPRRATTFNAHDRQVSQMIRPEVKLVEDRLTPVPFEKRENDVDVSFSDCFCPGERRYQNASDASLWRMENIPGIGGQLRRYADWAFL